jgi:hypothetical protein
MVTQRPLEALFMVRIHVGQPKSSLLFLLVFEFQLARHSFDTESDGFDKSPGNIS